MTEPKKRPQNISAAILAGGGSRRMGENKALLLYRGKPLVSHVFETLRSLFEDIFLVTNDPEPFNFLPCPKIPDRVPGKGPIAGIDAALSYSRTPFVFAVGCDAPFLSPRLLELLLEKTEGSDVVIPCGPRGPEPLCAVYGKGCLPLIEESLRTGNLRLTDLRKRLHTKEIPMEEVAAVDPGFHSFRNINTPREYQTLTRLDS